MSTTGQPMQLPVPNHHHGNLRSCTDGQDEFNPWLEPEERRLERYVRANGEPSSWAELAKNLNRSVTDVTNRFCQMRDDGEFTDLLVDGVLPNAKNRTGGDSLGVLSRSRGMFFSGSEETESSPIKNGRDLLTDRYTADEDKEIIEHVRRQGGSTNWAALADTLRRTTTSVWQRFRRLRKSGAFKKMKLVPARERIRVARAVRNERPLPEFGRSESEGEWEVESDEGSWTFQPQ
jgi:DNA-binding Lrp family transcriptional regulator